MAHQSLYRKYRPQTFEDVVGQSHVTRTLRNAVAEGSVAHAYLFTGPRGTGKTTTARILAKALECESGPTPDPDSTCDQCVAITEGHHPDVYELDAASRTQVEAVREEIIGRLAYPPVRGTWKLYIIDEVHMLSTHSFNALLKSIEEPPSNTVFVLCTTHPHKVPETIHSRCQRFDFHRIGVDDIVGRLEHIATAEGIEVAAGALSLVAKHAAGGMRDAIATLEQLAAFSGSSISLDDVEGLLGEVDSALLFEVADLVARRDVAASFRFVAKLAASGVDLPEFVREFVGHMRDLYVVAAVGDASGIVETPVSELGRLTSQATEFGPERLARALDLLGELTGELRWTPDPRLALEVALTRLARPHGELTLEALAERLEALETGASFGPSTRIPESRTTPSVPAASDSGGVNSAALTVPAQDAPEEPVPVQERAPRATAQPEATAEAVDDAAPAVPFLSAECPTSGTVDRAGYKRAWPAIVVEVRKLKSARGALFDGTEIDIDADGQTLVIEFPSDARFPMKQAASADNVALLKRAMTVVLGDPPPFRYQLGRGVVRPQESDDGEPISGMTPPEIADEPEAAVDVPELPELKTAPAPAPASTHAAPSEESPASDIESLMAETFGAEKVSETPHIEDETE